jgi:hypothetical protein
MEEKVIISPQYSEEIDDELQRIGQELLKNSHIYEEINRLILADAWNLARKDVNVMEPKEVTLESIQELEDKFSYRGVYFECNSGWDSIVKPLVDFVLDNGGTVDQVKEKFGGLRFYFTSTQDESEMGLWEEFYRMVREAEELSYKTCEFTGKPGRLRTKGKHGWLKTLCDEKAEEFGYDRTVDTPF